MIPFAPAALQQPVPAPDVSGLLDRARILRAEKHWPEAVALYTQILDIVPGHPNALLERAATLSWMKQFDASIRDYRQYLEAHPDEKAEVEPSLARVTAWSKRFLEAVKLLEPYVAKGDRQAILDTATFLSWDGQLNRSLALTGAWLAGQPADREMLILRARVLGWAGRHREARLAYGRVLAAAPTDREALLGLAQLDLWAGDPEGAATRVAALPPEEAKGAEGALMQSQIDQRQGRLRQARARAEALLTNPEAQEDAQSRLRDLADAQGPWVELSQTRTDSNEGLRAQTQRLDAAVPLGDGSLRVGGALNLLDQEGQAERKPQAWSLGFDQPLGTRVGLGAQIGRIDAVGGAAATAHSLSLSLRAAPGLGFSLYHSLEPVIATPRSTDLRTSIRTWGLGGNWTFNHTLDAISLGVERGFLSAGASRTTLRLGGGHRFPFEHGEARLGLASRLSDQNEILNLGFFSPQRYRYYGATAGATLRRDERWEMALDAWGGSQAVNQAASQFSWGYTLAGAWTPGHAPLSLFLAWSQSIAGLPVSDPADPSAYRDHTLRFGIRIRGNRWIW